MRIALFSFLVYLGCMGTAKADCVIELDRSQVDIVRGELRVDLGREIRERCPEADLRRLRLEQVKIVLDDDRFGRDRDRDRDRYRDRFRDRDRGDGGPPRRQEEYPIYRFYNGRQHMVSYDPNGGEQLGYGKAEGVRFSLFRDPGQDRIALYSCVVARKNDRFVSKDPNCEGFDSEGLLGYVYARPNERASRPLHRCFNRGGPDHLATTDTAECVNNGYNVEFVLGYVR